ncbi:MAG: retropepsin-like domain-containing protein [Euryarchaeota archaeon]|nr:retropepsin-like domain-containing protein [Euryarchaeota archaeon]MDE1836151.1 retropepsin-like domain-containing protein [Euryarchaeota archaeon]MDE1882186.1 retropepsin-like domain-containing protein [Euryarchaeota archaeon]MDE2044129.1 retropepsin-like domain-containing protein [Thermoplasmata archaeon]
MLLDTGATFSVLPSSVAEELDLELSAKPLKRTVVGGSVPARESKVRFQLASRDRSGRAVESFLLAPVQVTERGQDTPVPLLGRKPFLDRYEVTVRQLRKEFVLRES